MICRLALAALCVAAYASAQDHDLEMGGMTSPTLPKSFSDPMPLYPKALGKLHRPISSLNTDAQAYFDQGFQLMYAFGKQDATRSFREAEKRGPNCAICFWGEAWSWGSYLNDPMNAVEAPFAYAAAQKALSLAPGHSTPEERDLIEAMTHRYVEHFNSDKRRDQDMAYAEAMSKLAAKYPRDLDVLTLYADSLFVMEPRRGWRDINSPNVQRIEAVLEAALKIAPEHVGACHLYVHTEATTAPGKAEACADSLGQKIPGASHLNHMPAHTYNQIGRWGDSVRANIEAYHSDLKARVGEGFAIYPDHNLHMLLFAASMDGQGAIAMQAANDYFTLNGSNMMQVLTRIRFGRFDQVLESPSVRSVKSTPQSGISVRATRVCARVRSISPARISTGSTTLLKLPKPSSAVTPPTICSACSMASSKASFTVTTASSTRRSSHSNGPSSATIRLSMTNPSHFRSPHATGWAPLCSKPNGIRTRNESTVRNSNAIL
jgi:hypothetical protein